MKTTRTTCPYCGVGCGLLALPGGAVKADPGHPANLGRLCSKGAALGETIDMAGRLTTPMTDGKSTGWNEALGLVAEKFGRAMREHGPDSIGFYVSGQLLSEDYYVANKLMKGFIGAANIDTNSRLCMASSVAGHKRAFGSDTVPVSYEDLEQADIVVLAGSNMAWCHPVLFQRILEAKSNRPNMKIITIDPRRSATGRASDLHLAIRPDGDSALFNILLAEIVRCGAVDEGYVSSHVTGFEKTVNEAKKTNPADTGLSSGQIREFCRLWIGSQKVVTVFSQGINQSIAGTDKVNAIINCHLATGRIGQKGMGPFSITGQPNAMGGREVGGLANMLACHLEVENREHRQCVREFWQSPAICTRPGLKAIDLFRACDSGQIKALWIMGTNPAVSMPDADMVARAIGKVEFSVISEVMEKTDTCDLVDVKLPATTWGEKNGTVTNSERRISRQRAFLPVPGQARHDWQIICGVAKHMGWEEAFSYRSPAEIFREHAALSKRAAALGSDFDISGLAEISDEEYENLDPVRWPVRKIGRREKRFFSDGNFHHPDKRARMLPISCPLPKKTGPETFILNSGRIRDQWHTMTRTAKSPSLGSHMPEPFIQINPEDAGKLGLKDRELARIHGQQGTMTGRVMVDDGILKGTVFVPMHWSNTNSSAGKANVLTGSEHDPVSGQPALKGAHVKLKPLEPLWHGFAASAGAMVQSGFSYHALTRTRTGWSCELAGMTPVDDWQEKARRILNLEKGNASMMLDGARGVARVAIHEGEILRGVFFAAPGPLEQDRSHITAQINRNIGALAALAGAPGAERSDPGPTVCACFDVGVNAIKASILNGASTVVCIGRKTAAGTNCGACKPELQAMIEAEKSLKMSHMNGERHD